MVVAIFLLLAFSGFIIGVFASYISLKYFYDMNS